MEVGLYTPGKINMEPENGPNWKTTSMFLQLRQFSGSMWLSRGTAGHERDRRLWGGESSSAKPQPIERQIYGK